MAGTKWRWSAPADAEPCGITDVLISEFNLIHGSGNNPPDPKRLEPTSTLGDFYRAVHELIAEGRPRTALCLSGGGIRSASFALGVLQALASKNLLHRFHYLSTVSGGGYIGSWLSAWRARIKNDAQVMAELSGRTPDLYREPAEITGVRANSNYLTPRLGVLSADTWALLALYLRNLLLNWLIYLPLIVALLLLPRFALAALQRVATWPEEVNFGVLCGAGLLLALALATSVRGRLGGDQARRVTQNTYLLAELLPTYGSAMLFSLYAASADHNYAFSWYYAGAIGAGLNLLAWVLVFFAYSNRNPQVWKVLPAWVFAGALAGVLIGWAGQLASANIGYNGLRLLAIFGVGWIAVSMFLAESIYLGITSYSKKGEVEREWMARSSGWFVAMTVCWAALAAVVLYAPDITGGINKLLNVAITSLAGLSIGAIVAGIGTSAKTISTLAGKPVENLSMTKVLSIASIVFLLVLALVLGSALPKLVDLVSHLLAILGIHLGAYQENAAILSMIVFCVGFAFCLSPFVNVNRFSSHALYRNRLARAFLGSARGDGAKGSPTRDPFTGFDDADNIYVSELLKAGSPNLFHVVNMALNVVAGTNNAWQERKAESFVVTPQFAGNEYVQFCPTDKFGSRHGGITLGTSMAISGAAASPNQGYHSSPLIGLVMTLFNVRLGWWLGNPSKPRKAIRESPKWGILQIFKELFGLTKDTSSYVYLSDGGHFENLGLYEMVRRRCHLIVVSDGGCDPKCTFEDLGNASRKIWIDLGISIKFRKIEIRKRDSTPAGVYCALGKIQYPEREQGDVSYVLYIKPGFRNDGTEPPDVCAYALANDAFPHESTADQFFTESQMESYRSLGAYIVETIMGDPAGTLDRTAPTEGLRPYWANLKQYL